MIITKKKLGNNNYRIIAGQTLSEIGFKMKIKKSTIVFGIVWILTPYTLFKLDKLFILIILMCHALMILWIVIENVTNDFEYINFSKPTIR